MIIKKFYYFKPKESFTVMTTEGNPKYLWKMNSYRAAPFICNDGFLLYVIFDTVDMGDPCIVMNKKSFKQHMAKTHIYDPDNKGILKRLYEKISREYGGKPV